ncbi:hemagglutinin repeat-containing protein, partial [Enterobacter hormaechei]|uniref:hemagglutinin repeat-containing protein n=1 Tax=Enterobacter hormaechei TaxID=158836 RepID=UPI0035A3B155
MDQRQDATFDDRNHQHGSQTTHAVSSVQGGGDVVLSAGKAITLAAAQLAAAGGMALRAEGDINSLAVVDGKSFDSAVA